jgi:hypothetical protein
MESNSCTPRVFDEAVDVLVLVAGRCVGGRAVSDVRRRTLQRIAAFFVQPFRDRQDVLGTIAVRRECNILTAQLEIT